MVSVKSKNTVPLEFKYDNNTGQINCVKALEGIDLSMFTKIYFVMLYEHEVKYHIAEKIAVARKLLVIACAILNSQKPYEENHISCYNKNSVKIA